MIGDPIRVAQIVAKALEACRLRYLVGGSLASSLSGEPRSTMDVDLVVELDEVDIIPLISALGKDFHVDSDLLRRAARERSSANLIHYESSIKVDLFVAGGSPLDREQMDRRLRVGISADPNDCLYVYTPEDILLQKLRWYRLGKEVSERQWRDCLGVVRVQEKRLDEAYLRRAAGILGVADLLERVLSSAKSD
ncbi:MAG: hypothetical protein L0170_12510 [Acidobacteria bacterium]|nr:hypothetical protein [Acidobacteriota bacterium]